MSLSKERVFATPKELLRPNEIPSVMVVGRTLPEVWENAVLATMEYGCRVPTQYDSEFDPESKAVSMAMMLAEPFAEPRIHKCFPDGITGLYVYTQEVIAGIHDQRIKEGGWSYSYHDRLTNWPGVDGWKLLGNEAADLSGPHVNQIDLLVRQLSEVPFTRRAQAITWNPLNDATHHEPPCLQRIWCQIIKGENDELLLEMNTHWRSRDAFKAAFMNMFAVTELQKLIAEKISSVSGRKVLPGRYFDISDNFHIYGSYLRRGEMEGFLQSLDKRSFDQRTLRSDDPLVLEQRAEAETHG